MELIKNKSGISVPYQKYILLIERQIKKAIRDRLIIITWVADKIEIKGHTVNGNTCSIDLVDINAKNIGQITHLSKNQIRKAIAKENNNNLVSTQRVKSLNSRVMDVIGPIVQKDERFQFIFAQSNSDVRQTSNYNIDHKYNSTVLLLLYFYILDGSLSKLTHGNSDAIGVNNQYIPIHKPKPL